MIRLHDMGRTLRRMLPAAPWTLVMAMAWAGGAESADRKKPRTADEIVLASDYARFAPASIALWPAATFDGSVEARTLSENTLAQALRGSGHRWLSSTLTRDLVRRNAGDSLVDAVSKSLLEGPAPRFDSLAAPAVCRATRTRAVLAIRVDRWSRNELEFNQAGHPSTSVMLRACLVDSTGRLLWTASGSETIEGPYQDPSTAAVGVKASGLGQQPLTNQGKAPAWQEVLGKIVARWAAQFPRYEKPAHPSEAELPSR